ncbi:phenylacetic acid degradation protein PaaY [Parahaliea mediterranea]|uniref:Phenylacetic acid degradation protein PaaY n=1 Tax=Parahaliea mediterranea TaxID=651086 RepID=A0A939DGC8_9GAMM|nr:phenylacetic acid degradation protein PaaY [Parahaliea mediterranea]MBN7797366.1 phenylacetic acid degradation protein PaaY [Parahaliea mediterranea]
MPVFSIDGITPVVDPTAFVHETAVLIGDAIVGPGAYVGPNAVMRGDFGRLILGPGANLQDTCIMHGFPGTDTEVEENGHIGHGAVLHGCRIGRNTLVGMNAVIMDGAEIGPECIVAACAFVKAKFHCDARSMLVGSPARLLRQVTDEEIAWKSRGTAEYQALSRRCLQTLRPAEPLAAVEADRRRIVVEDVQPLYKSRG